MRKNRTFFYIAVYLIFVLAVWGLLFLAPRPKVIEMEKQPNVLDLSGADFDGAVYHYLNGGWDRYPEMLLTPEDLQGENTPQPLEQLPGEAYRRVQYISHRLVLRLPPGEIYGLTMKSSDYAMRFFIDDEEAGLVGLPAETAETNVPRVTNQTYYFQPESEETVLLVQASNWVHREGAFAPAFYVGSAGDVDAYNRYTLLTTFLIGGCLLTSFLHYLGLFVLNRSRTATLVFSLCCLLLGLMALNVPALFFPQYNWYAAIRIEYLVHYLAFASITLFLDLLFPRLLHRFATRPYYVLTALYILVTFLLPTNIFTRLLVGFHLASALIAAYMLVRLAMQLKKRNPQSILAFWGVAVICLLTLNDVLATNSIYFLGRIAGQSFTTPIAMTFFVFCYGMVLSLEYAETERAMLKAQKSEQRLEADNLALDRLNSMKSDLIATVSHETRTPLAVLSGYAELISMDLRKKGVGEQTARDLDNIAEETQRIAALLDELQKTTYGQSAAAGKARLELWEVIEGAARLYRPILARKGTVLAAASAGLASRRLGQRRRGYAASF